MEELFIRWIDMAIFYLENAIFKIENDNYLPFVSSSFDVRNLDADKVKSSLKSYPNFLVTSQISEQIDILYTILKVNKKHTLILTDEQQRLLDEIELFMKKENDRRINQEPIEELRRRLDKYKSIKDGMKNGIFYQLSGDVHEHLLEDAMLPNSMKLPFLASFKSYVDRTLEIKKPDPVKDTVLSFEEVSRVFDDYKYSLLSISKKGIEHILKYGNIDKMKEIFEALALHNIDFMIESLKSFPLFITYSSKDIIDSLVKTVSDNGFNPNVLFRITNVFIPNGKRMGSVCGAYDNFMSNLATFKRIGIEFSTILDIDLSVLLIPNMKLEESIKLLDEYGLKDYTKFLVPALKSKSFALMIDRYIEAGRFDYISGNSSKLVNRDKLPFYRMRFAEEKCKADPEFMYTKKVKGDNRIWFIGDIFDEQGFGITGDNYLEMTNTILPEIDGSDIYESYVDNAEISFNTDDEAIKEIEGYKNGNTYVFGSKIISRMKVIRIYNALLKSGVKGKGALLYAICYDSIVSEEEFNAIKDIVMSLQIGMVR